MRFLRAPNGELINLDSVETIIKEGYADEKWVILARLRPSGILKPLAVGTEKECIDYLDKLAAQMRVADLLL